MATRTIVRLADQSAGFITNASASATYQAKVANVSNEEIGYLDGVTSGIQSQINSKLSASSASTTYAPISSPTFTGTVSGVTKSMVGLENVDNTSDANKPISSATQTALNAKAPLASPVFTGTATIPSGSSISSLTITSGTIASTGSIALSPASGNLIDINRIVRMSDVYNRTTTAASNMLIATVPLAEVYRSTASSQRWKNSIEDLSGELDASKLLDLPVHQFKFNNDYLDENDQRYETFVPGFIAEEVAEVYPIAAELDGEGLPSDWNVRLLLPPMLQLIQDQAKKIEELESRLSLVENS